jgi:hypothetical protein
MPSCCAWTEIALISNLLGAAKDTAFLSNSNLIECFKILPPERASSFTAVDVGVVSVVAVVSCALGLDLVLGIFAVNLRHGDSFASRFL